jgi:hypothetical protein
MQGAQIKLNMSRNAHYQNQQVREEDQKFQLKTKLIDYSLLLNCNFSTDDYR